MTGSIGIITYIIGLSLRVKIKEWGKQSVYLLDICMEMC